MDQSDHFVWAEYFSIFHSNIPPLELGMLVRIPVVAIEVGMVTS